MVCGSMQGIFDVATNLFMPLEGAHLRGMTGTEFERRAGEGGQLGWRSARAVGLAAR